MTFTIQTQTSLLPHHHEEALQKRIKAIPAVQTLGFEAIKLYSGTCIATMPRKPDLDGAFLSYHGGLLTTAADMAACFAILTQTDPERAVTTTDLNIRFLRPCLSDIQVEAHVIKMGRTLCPAYVRILNSDKKEVAAGTITYMLLDDIYHQPNLPA